MSIGIDEKLVFPQNQMSDPPMTYVTQEDWDKAQAALSAALAFVEQHKPPLSTVGTTVSLIQQIRAAIKG
jgi:predicted lysophospholipase L1 biosynthesis ABC-type transport system permease subunit